MLDFVSKYKKYLIGILIAAVVVVGFNLYVSKKEKESYDRGFQVANTLWEKKGKEYVGLIDKERARSASVNYALTLVTEGKIIEEEKRRAQLTQHQAEYLASPAAEKKSLDDSFIRLYNESLGD